MKARAAIAYFWVCRLLFRALPLALAFVLLLPSQIAPQGHAADAASSECYEIRYSFLQPWGDQYFTDPEEWAAEFRQLRGHGVEHAILQWTLWGKEIYSNPTLPEWLPAALEAANDTGTQLWVGLRYDPELLENIKGYRAEDYMEWRLAEAEDAAALLGAYLQDHPTVRQAVAGWYIADEVDNTLLMQGAANELLTRFLSAQRQVMTTAVDMPVAVTSYASGDLPRNKLAQHLADFMDHTGASILFMQDSLGVALQSRKQAKTQFTALRELARERSWKVVPVVEIFDINQKDKSFSSLSVEATTALERIKLASQTVQEPLALFSVSVHVLHDASSNGKELSSLLRKNRLGCPLEQ